VIVPGQASRSREAVAGDGTGLVLVAKRLEKSSFRWPRISDGVMRLTSSQLSALLQGLDWARVRAVRVPAPQATL
jgi:transposase